MFESSHRPDGKIADALASTLACTTTNASRTLRSTTVCTCHRDQNFPSPRWETHILLVLFAGRRCLCLFRHRHNDVLLDHRQHSFLCACSSSKLPIAPIGFSHVLRAITGWRCLRTRLWWLGDLLIVHHHWQLSWICACSRSKVPIAPMGFSHVLRLCLQGGGVMIDGGTVSFSSCTITGNTASVRAHV